MDLSSRRGAILPPLVRENTTASTLEPVPIFTDFARDSSVSPHPVTDDASPEITLEVQTPVTPHVRAPHRTVRVQPDSLAVVISEATVASPRLASTDPVIRVEVGPRLENKASLKENIDRIIEEGNKRLLQLNVAPLTQEERDSVTTNGLLGTHDTRNKLFDNKSLVIVANHTSPQALEAVKTNDFASPLVCPAALIDWALVISRDTPQVAIVVKKVITDYSTIRQYAVGEYNKHTNAVLRVAVKHHLAEAYRAYLWVLKVNMDVSSIKSKKLEVILAWMKNLKTEVNKAGFIADCLRRMEDEKHMSRIAGTLSKEVTMAGDRLDNDDDEDIDDDGCA
jgi:hypothetical protein